MQRPRISGALGRLTILSVAYPLAVVGPDATGGAEQVLGMLDRALARAGHHSIVIAPQGSRVAGTLVAVPRREGAMTDGEWVQAHDAHRRALASVLAEYPVQLIHFHGCDFIRYLPECDLPMLATLHLPAAWYDPQIFSLRRPSLQLQCVSRAQRLRCPPSSLLGPDIENGVPVERLALYRAKEPYAVVLGRICPEKGVHLALEAARLAGAPLRIAGPVYRYPAHVRYFEDDIAPRLDAERRYLGPLGFDAKAALLAAARCLLVPSLAETSSLAAMEALAAGTPVIAFKVGALPDMVEDGVTGFLVDDVMHMAEAIGRADQLDPAACRAAARARFSQERMVSAYLERYRRLAAA